MRKIFTFLLITSVSNFAFAQTFKLQSTTPIANTNSVAQNANIVLTFNDSVDGVTVADSTIIVYGEQTGLVAGNFSGGGTKTVTFNPDTIFQPGEVIRVTLTTGLKNTDSVALDSSVQFEFRVATGYFAPGNYVSFTIDNSANGAYSVFASDIDSDGDMDVLSASHSDNTIAWYENDGNQNFLTHTIATNAGNASSVFASDIDSDGDMDVLSASYSDDKIAWYENDGNQNFTTHTISLNADYAQSVYATDMDGDDDIDVLSASVFDNKIAWYENDGNQNFTTDTITSNANDASSVYAADVDGDGDMDVLSASVADDKIAWYENDGNQNFTSHSIDTNANEARSVYAADMDGDGDIDVLSAASIDNQIAWYENDGNQSFTPRVIDTNATYAHCVYAADIDNDGDMDAVSASSNDDKIAWYAFTCSSISTFNDTACFSYISPSGQYVWTTTGTYMDTISNFLGCDSILTVNLFIKTANVSVSQNFNTLTVIANNAISYQWLDCNNSKFPIPGATSQTYVAPTTGSFAVVVVQQNGCTDTSACIAVTNLDISKTELLTFAAYPNPTDGAFTLQMDKMYNGVTLTITDVAGRVIKTVQAANTQKIQLQLDATGGIYFVKVATQSGKSAVMQVVKR